MPRQPADEGPKDAGVSIRTTRAFREKLTLAAKENGRSLAQEVERRLEASFDTATADAAQKRATPDVLAERFSPDVLDYLRAYPVAADLMSTFAAAMKTTNRISRDRGHSELDAREAVRVAWGVVQYFHLNMGENGPPALRGPMPKLGTKRADLPARFLGHEVAADRVGQDARWEEHSVALDTMDGRIRNHWSGDGSEIVSGPSEEEVAADEERRLKAAKEALARGEIEFERPENLSRYKRSWTFDVEDDASEQTPLNEIFKGR